VAGLPSSRHTIHRSLRPSDLRAGENSPLSTNVPPLESKNLPFPVVIRGASDPATAPRPQLDRNDPPSVGCRNCNDPSTVPVLRPRFPTEFMMQY
jgi:hypothetical protein